MPTNQDYWFQPAIDRLKIERDETAQKSLILLLWYAQTNAADGAISAFADTSKSSMARDYTQKIMQNKDKIGAKQRAEALALTEASLRQKRHERLKAVSDEALIDLDDYTMMLLAKRK